MLKVHCLLSGRISKLKLARGDFVHLIFTLHHLEAAALLFLCPSPFMAYTHNSSFWRSNFIKNKLLREHMRHDFFNHIYNVKIKWIKSGRQNTFLSNEFTFNYIVPLKSVFWHLSNVMNDSFKNDTTHHSNCWLFFVKSWKWSLPWNYDPIFRTEIIWYWFRVAKLIHWDNWTNNLQKRWSPLAFKIIWFLESGKCEKSQVNKNDWQLKDKIILTRGAYFCRVVRGCNPKKLFLAHWYYHWYINYQLKVLENEC